MDDFKKYRLLIIVLMYINYQNLYSDTGPLALSEGININSSGTVQITVQANVVSSANVANSVVGRDDTGSFATNMIAIAGNPTNPTDVATKKYVDLIASLGFTFKTAATVVANSNCAISGLYDIDGVTLVDNDRVILTGQTNAIQNGLWVARASSWTRPTDFANGAQASASYVLIAKGVCNIGSSWICKTPNAVIGTDPITFAQFALQSQTAGLNVGDGVGQIYKNKLGVNLNFKSIAAGLHVLVNNNLNDITLSTDATSDNTVDTIVARDDVGSFAANVVTANSLVGPVNGSVTGNVQGNLVGNVSGVVTGSLVGNASTATSATSANTATNFTGSLAGDVTGTQSGTVVNTVSGVSASSVASGANLANAATNLNTNNAIVKRDSVGSFAANVVTVNSLVGPVTGSVTGNVLGNIIGNVSGVVTGSLVGNASTATSANTATNFTGSLVGDVTGTQSGTVVSIVSGVSAGSVASGANLANAATNLNTNNAIVKRDSVGSFVANVVTVNSLVGPVIGSVTGNLQGNLVGNVSGIVTGSLVGNASTATSATSANTATNFTGSLVGDVTGTQSGTVVSTVSGVSASNVASGANLANAATNLNTNNAIVKRDSVGSFVANVVTVNSLVGPVIGSVTGNLQGNLVGNVSGVVTGSLVGNASTATSATSANTATNFTGSLVGDVTGTQSGTVVSIVSGVSASSVASGANLANAATNLNTNNAIVKRDSVGSFAANVVTANSLVGPVTGSVTGNVQGNLVGNVSGVVTGSLVGNASTATSATSANTATNFTGSLAGDVTGTQSGTVVSTVSGVSAGSVASGANLANAATNLNTNNAIVKRDSVGSFAANVVTANSLVGPVTGSVTGNVQGNLVGNVSGVVTGSLIGNVVGNVSGVVTGSLVGNASTATSATSADTATNNVLKSGDTMTGSLQLPAGSATNPSLNFTGSTTTGLSAATTGKLSLDAGGVEAMNMTSAAINTNLKLVLGHLLCNQADLTVVPANNNTITTLSNTAILILKHTSNISNLTVVFPPNPTDGQFFTILLGTTNTITTLNNSIGTGGGTIVNAVTSLAPGTLTATTGGTSVTYYYSLASNAWYRYARG